MLSFQIEKAWSAGITPIFMLGLPTFSPLSCCVLSNYSAWFLHYQFGKERLSRGLHNNVMDWCSMLILVVINSCGTKCDMLMSLVATQWSQTSKVGQWWVVWATLNKVFSVAALSGLMRTRHVGERVLDEYEKKLRCEQGWEDGWMITFIHVFPLLSLLGGGRSL